MGKKLLTEGLQRILETFDDEDCPHEQYFRSILNEAIQEQDAVLPSELNELLCKLADDFETIAKQWDEKAKKQQPQEFFEGQYEGMAMAFGACSLRIKQDLARLKGKQA